MATVGIIGLGYVGLPLAVAFAQAGCDVIAVDVDPRKIEAIAAGDSYIEDVPSELLRAFSGRIHATTRYARLAKADAVLICVPTPLTSNREPDLGPLDRLPPVRWRRCFRPISWWCSSPRPTRGRRASAWRRSWRSPGLPRGRDFHLAFSPERVDPGRTDFTLRNTPEGAGRADRGVRRARRGAVRPGVREPRARLEPRGGRADEAVGEHLPLGEHRAGQRACDAHRPHGNRHLGGSRGGLDQAVRVHALRSRARAWAAIACRSTRSI